MKSIQDLEITSWEIIISPHQNDSKSLIPTELNQDPRIRVSTSDTKGVIDLVTGDYVLICEAGDVFFKDLLSYFIKYLSEDESVDWYYYDCEYFDENSREITPLFKPPSLSPELLLSINYLSRGLFAASYLIENSTSSAIENNLLDLEYALALKLCENNGIIKHIPQVLVRQTGLVKPDTQKKQRVAISHLKRLGLKNISAQPTPFGTHFTWFSSNPSVAIIMPSTNNRDLIEPCLKSLFKNTNYNNFSVHIIDNDSDDPNTLSFYQEIKTNPKIKIHPYHNEFNYSEANNLGAAQSNSDLLLFLNDDMEVHNTEWLSELVQWAERPEIGVVGTKLIRENRIIQHAGIIIGLNGFAGHIYLNAPEHYQGLFGSVDWYRDFMAVTGACQMIRRDVFEEVQGFDEGYKLAFGDIDLCLRIRNLGYRIVYTPFASIFHYEGQSRGYATPKEDIIRGFNEMKSALFVEDPYFSPNLTYTRIPKYIMNSRSPGELENLMEIRKNFYLKNE
ncbi:MAG: glycosyltransferase family 2 protein [Chloroflexota bacterium]|nr:glycosyltransferase family 2 protein [Chloroflexota bacterium]